MSANSASSTLSRLQAGSLVMGRYRILDDKPLGEGGWCDVWKARHEISGQEVALKTFRDQIIRETGVEVLNRRFAKEIAVFKMLGVADGNGKIAVNCKEASLTHAGQHDPKQLFVNLLDFSCNSFEHSEEEEGKLLDLHNREPAKAMDGRYYIVLDLADWSLEKWITTRSTNPVVGCAELYEVARALSRSLAWLHACNLCHNDVKPANVVRFGARWKLIDL